MKKRYLIAISAFFIMSSNIYADNYFLLVRAVGKITNDISSLKVITSIQNKSIKKNSEKTYQLEKMHVKLLAKYKVVLDKLNSLQKEIDKVEDRVKKIENGNKLTNQQDIRIIKQYINKP